MKKIIMITTLIFSVGVLAMPADGHKLISHDGTHRSFESALQIPDHRISWAIYESLGPDEARFYSFEAKHGEPFYASIVVPKINGLERYSPTMVLVGPGIFEDDVIPFETQYGAKKIPYDGKFPGREFYEPFGQVTYWERQEISTTISEDGQYFIVVMDEKNQNGKYSLAIGTVEDFSGSDFFTVLPKAWLETKLFVDDYFSIGILLFMLVLLSGIIIMAAMRKRRK